MPDNRLARGRSARWALAVVLAWAVVNVPWAVISHYALRTNAFDLSVFDYALWSLESGGLGRVPFLGHSLFAHHFMPTLGLVALPHALWPSPVMLILLQSMCVAGAAAILWVLASRAVPPPVAVALVGAFLFSRYSNGAISSLYYVESFEPLLVFGFVLACRNRRWRWYWPLIVLALGCKEDMPVYVVGFAVITALEGKRRLAGYTAALAACWLVFALFVAIPTVRGWDGLPQHNPFVEARFGPEAASGELMPTARRLFSIESAKAVARATLSVAGICFAGPEWLAVATPGALLNLAADKSTSQAWLLGHYAWPILPWIYLASIAGGHRLARRSRHTTAILTGALILVTLVDSPLWLRFRRLADLPWAEAGAVRADLRALPREGTVLAMPNLIPHIPKRRELCAIGAVMPCPFEPDYVAISATGDLWPLDVAQVQAEITRYESNPRYQVVTSGPLHLFRRIGASP